MDLELLLLMEINKMKIINVLILTLLSFNIFAIDRFALVIGNSGYSIDSLDNTINDANDVSDSFNSLGYAVTTVIDGNRQSMESAITSISKSLTRDSMLVFYYAGHAAQVDNSNYLIPVNEDIKNENDLKYKSVNLDWILGAFKSSLSRTNIIILDSCRDNPFRDATRGGGTRGLTVVSAPASNGTEIKNTAIIYATTDGNTADDGEGRNSPFTSAFLKNINRENETVLDVMTYVTQDVFTKSGGKQEPTMTNALKEKVYFIEPVVRTASIIIEEKGSGLSITTDISGELFINNQFITYINNGEIKEVFDIDPGTYNLEFFTDSYSEIITIDVIGNQIIPVYFQNQSSKSLPVENMVKIDNQLENLISQRQYLEITKSNLDNEIYSLENQMDLHKKYKDKRDRQRKTSMNTGFFSFMSFIGAGASAYFAYENYNNYNNATTTDEAVTSREITSGFLIGAVGAALVGSVSTLISNYTNKKVIKYDLQEDIFLTQIKSKKLESIKLNNEYDEVVFIIKQLN